MKQTEIENKIRFLFTIVSIVFSVLVISYYKEDTSSIYNRVFRGNAQVSDSTSNTSDTSIVEFNENVIHTTTPDYNIDVGKILYKIPKKMQHNNWHRCIVRIALNDKILLKEYIVDSLTIIKNIRVTKKMDVSISETNFFDFKKHSAENQIIEKDDFTEWIFDVKPKKLGKFPLTLRVNIVLKDGIKSRILTENIEVVSIPVGTSITSSFEQLPIEPSNIEQNKFNYIFYLIVFFLFVSVFIVEINRFLLKRKNNTGLEIETEGLIETIELLLEKKNFFLKESVIAVDPSQKFALQKQLEEIVKKIEKHKTELDNIDKKKKKEVYKIIKIFKKYIKEVNISIYNPNIDKENKQS